MILENELTDSHIDDRQSAATDAIACKNIFFELTADKNSDGLPDKVILPSPSVDQFLHVKLLTLLDSVEAPDYLFKAIIKWASLAKDLNYNFSPRLTTQSAVLTDLQTIST